MMHRLRSWILGLSLTVAILVGGGGALWYWPLGGQAVLAKHALEKAWDLNARVEVELRGSVGRLHIESNENKRNLMLKSLRIVISAPTGTPRYRCDLSCQETEIERSAKRQWEGDIPLELWRDLCTHHQHLRATGRFEEYIPLLRSGGSELSEHSLPTRLQVSVQGNCQIDLDQLWNRMQLQDSLIGRRDSIVEDKRLLLLLLRTIRAQHAKEDLGLLLSQLDLTD